MLQKLRKANHNSVDQTVLKLLFGVRSQNMLFISGALVQKKPLHYFRSHGNHILLSLTLLMVRYDSGRIVTLKPVSGESNIMSSWKEMSLPTILSYYDLKDIYNAEAFGLFYLCLNDGYYLVRT